jgi:hypothetical protein
MPYFKVESYFKGEEYPGEGFSPRIEYDGEDL